MAAGTRCDACSTGAHGGCGRRDGGTGPYVGPFTIKRMTSATTAELALPDRWAIHPGTLGGTGARARQLGQGIRGQGPTAVGG